MGTTTNKKFSDAVRAVGADLWSLSREECAGELQHHEDDDIARMLMETNAMCLTDVIREDKDGS